jgi:hypothetical protein
MQGQIDTAIRPATAAPFNLETALPKGFADQFFEFTPGHAFQRIA